jgi:hypothetical protein
MFNVRWCITPWSAATLAKLKQFFAFFMSSGLKLIYVLGGKGNPHKAPEGLRRRLERAAAEVLLAEATNKTKVVLQLRRSTMHCAAA